MTPRNHRLAVIFATILVSFLFVACARGEVQRASEVVELGDASSARVEVTMAAGTLEIDGGARPLMDAEFVYNVPDWKPKVDYSVSGGQGTLTVQQPVSTDVRLRDVRYEWQLALNDDVPLDLRVKLGAGDNTLDLSGLTLTNLEIIMGAGNVSVDLTGTWDSGFDTLIRGGLGKATVRLPSTVGTRVRVQGGLGRLTAVGLVRDGDAYVNEAYGKTDVTLNIEIQGAAGEVTLEVAE
jgi:hypothetical protein